MRCGEERTGDGDSQDEEETAKNLHALDIAAAVN